MHFEKMKPNASNFNDMPVAATRRFLLRRFAWLRRDRATLDFALALQNDMRPMPSGYYRWHLPRIIATMTDLLLPACRRFQKPPRILIVGSWPGFTHLFREWLACKGVEAECLVPTSRSGDNETFSYRGTDMSFSTDALTIAKTALPWPDACFDVVVVCEIIEHLMEHPQYFFSEVNRILGKNGNIIVTTPNVISWKKLYAGSRGNWGFDSPTFGGEWGHRYEYSSYQLHNMLTECGFAPVIRKTRDVYLDDPAGMRQLIQKYALAVSKVATGDIRAAVKLIWHSGSTLLFLYARQKAVSREEVTFVRA